MTEHKYLFWDFDGTLGCRIDGLHGKAWSASMLEAIVELDPDSSIRHEDIIIFLHEGFPWQEPEIPHLHLNSPELWWEKIRHIFKKTYYNLGFTELQSESLSHTAQKRFVDLKLWILYDDVLPALHRLNQKGWKHAIVSNHVPELQKITEHLGLSPYLSFIVNSALVGYEKPHSEIFKIALEKAEHPETVWMIGDNVIADVIGAEEAGISSILIRNMDERAKYQFADLAQLEHFFEKE